MIQVSSVFREPPAVFGSELQEQVYRVLMSLEIPFERVDNEPAITMEDCLAINERLQVKTTKSLFLCNRQQTMFYLFVTRGDKPFRTKDFGAALGISRVSFAPEDFLEPMLGTQIGATTLFSMLLPRSEKVSLVLDHEIFSEAFYAGTDGTTTGYLRFPTADLSGKLLPHLGREYRVIEV